MIDLLRQRSRPYLFSNSVAPPIVVASIKAIDLLSGSTELRDKLQENTRYFREKIAGVGLEVLPGEHPIVPVMFGEATPAVKMAEKLLEKGVYVIPFSFPVVPKGKARIRTQVSAAHSKEDLDFAVEKFAEAKAELGI
jgi:glycine C-acetyltransferase